MATKLLISTGPLSAELNYANDAKAQATLLAFYDAFSLGPSSATNQQKLQAIVNWLALFIREKAILHHIEVSRAAATEEASTLYDLGGQIVEPGG